MGVETVWNICFVVNVIVTFVINLFTTGVFVHFLYLPSMTGFEIVT